jgi:hypothetical protein
MKLRVELDANYGHSGTRPRVNKRTTSTAPANQPANPTPHALSTCNSRTVAHACSTFLQNKTPTSTITATDSDGCVIKTTETDMIYSSSIVIISNVHFTESPPADTCHGCNLERVGAVGLARRCSKEQETIYTKWSIYMMLWTNCLAYTLSRLASSEYAERICVTGLTRDNTSTVTDVLTTTVPAACDSRPYVAPSGIGDPVNNNIYFAVYPDFPNDDLRCCAYCYSQRDVTCIASYYDLATGNCELLVRQTSALPGASEQCPLGIYYFNFGKPNTAFGHIFQGPCGK